MLFLLVDGTKLHLTVEGLQKMKSWTVVVVVFPQHLTDVIQALDKDVFRTMKDSFRKRKEH